MALKAETPESISAFLKVPTPAEWVGRAIDELPTLLVDHANCELKAASTAMAMINRYPAHDRLCDRMSRLAREELRHYEQVRKLMKGMGIAYERLSASRYAGGLRDAVRGGEPERLLDSLLVGAIIEARSCERFAVVAPKLEKKLGDFYRGLLASEARHFENYLALAATETGIEDAEIERRLAELLDIEAGLITRPDAQFRFHSGLPDTANSVEFTEAAAR